jgi:LmbE family N-acetylglucosaminyl deacetylase
MPGWTELTDHTVFSDVPVEAVAARLAELLDRYRPDVVLTHNAHAGHEHVDHRHAARATALAIQNSDTSLYFSGHGVERWRLLEEALAQNGIHCVEPDWERLCALAEIESASPPASTSALRCSASGPLSGSTEVSSRARWRRSFPPSNTRLCSGRRHSFACTGTKSC